MPRGNGMGPLGAGPMTGRAAGACAGYGQPGFAGRGAGRGCGFGGGRGQGGQGRGGRGFRNMFLATGLPGWMRTDGNAAANSTGGFDEKQLLANQAKALQAQLANVQERLEQL